MKPDKLLTLGMTEQLNLEEILQLCSGECSKAFVSSSCAYDNKLMMPSTFYLLLVFDIFLLREQIFFPISNLCSSWTKDDLIGPISIAINTELVTSRQHQLELKS